ncbi:MAG: hypothetical protein JKY90_03545 [Gammaproteobacteria bacterium]|nr:hypothetical protein [Gammaproteobacteria bacterium]
MTTQRQIIYNCVRSCVYFRKISRQVSLDEPYIHIKNVLASDAVLGWAKIFGNNKEKHHWSDFVKCVDTLPFKYESFNSEKILKATKFTIDEWDDYRNNVLACRDKIFAHTDSYKEIKDQNPIFPDLSAIIYSASCYYSWLFGLWNAAREKEPLYKHKRVQNNFSKNIDDEIKKFNLEANTYLSFER